jgi:transposase
MPKSYQITKKQVVELEATRKENKDKNVERRLKALLLRAQGIKRAEVASQTEFATSYISELTAKYCNQGLSAIVENHCGGNHRNLSFAEEEALLEPFKKLAESGQIVEVSEILAAYETKLGRPTGSNSQIYYVLARHGWRKVMPRSKHPNKASEEEIESSKKLT